MKNLDCNVIPDYKKLLKWHKRIKKRIKRGKEFSLSIGTKKND